MRTKHTQNFSYNQKLTCPFPSFDLSADISYTTRPASQSFICDCRFGLKYLHKFKRLALFLQNVNNVNSAADPGGEGWIAPPPEIFFRSTTKRQNLGRAIPRTIFCMGPRKKICMPPRTFFRSTKEGKIWAAPPKKMPVYMATDHF